MQDAPRARSSALIACILSCTLAACGGGDGGPAVDGGPAPDTTPPSLASTFPADMARNVARNVVLLATFSEPVQPATVTTSSFTLLRMGAGAPVTAEVALSSDGRTATLTPAAPLEETATYTAAVHTDIKDLVGNKMAARRTWTFTVEYAAPTVVSQAPPGGATGLRGDAPLSAVFSNALLPATLTAESFSVRDGTTAVAGALTLEPA